MLTVKTLRFYQEIKQSVSQHWTIALFSLFNVLNHTLELRILESHYETPSITSPVYIWAPNNLLRTNEQRFDTTGQRNHARSHGCFRSFFNPFTRWEIWQWKVRVQNALPLSALCPNLIPASLWESSPGCLLANPTVLPIPFHYSRRN